MTTPKSKKANDIATSNRIAAYLTPYLFSDEQITMFIAKRALEQAKEIDDPAVRLSTISMVYFSAYEAEKGIESAEEALRVAPNDTVTWKHYMLGMFWRCGPERALEIAQRSRKFIKSYEIVRNAMFYSIQLSDFSAFSELYLELTKAEKLDELVKEKKEKNALSKAMVDCKMAEASHKTEVIKSLSSLMFNQLSHQQKLNAVPRLLDVSDEDGSSFLLELYVSDSDPKTCSEMNRKLISERSNAGLTDWDVGGMFVSRLREEAIYASKA